MQGNEDLIPHIPVIDTTRDPRPQFQNVDKHDYRTNDHSVSEDTSRSLGVNVQMGLQELQQFLDVFKTYRYLCQTKLVATMSEEELRHHAIPITGIRAFDQSAKYEVVERWMTVEDMIRVRRRNFPIAIVERSDCEAIFAVIQKYVATYTQYVERAITMPHGLLQDLIDLDELAKDLFPHLPTTVLNPFRTLLDARMQLLMDFEDTQRPAEYSSVGDYLKSLQQRG